MGGGEFARRCPDAVDKEERFGHGQVRQQQLRAARRAGQRSPVRPPRPSSATFNSCAANSPCQGASPPQRVPGFEGADSNACWPKARSLWSHTPATGVVRAWSSEETRRTSRMTARPRRACRSTSSRQRRRRQSRGRNKPRAAPWSPTRVSGWSFSNLTVLGQALVHVTVGCGCGG